MPGASGRSARSGRTFLWRGMAAVAGVALLGWLVLSVGLAAVSARANPDLALRFQPGDARANARKAELIIAQGVESRQRRVEAETYARRALARESVSVVAWRVLGLVAGGNNDAAGARRYFQISSRLSRRDLPTQLWLIEEAVERDQIAEALKHYDAALRITASSHDMLLPVLVSATNDSRIVDELIPVLRRNPWWRRAFIGRLADNPPDTSQAVRLIRALAPGGKLPEADLARFMITKMVEKHAISDAWQVYAILKGDPGARATPLRDGQFGIADSIVPFEWQLETNADLGAEQQGYEEGGVQAHVLHVYARSGSTGFVARQLVMLPPGSYSVTGMLMAVADANAARPYWTVVCDGDGVSLGEGDIAVAGETRGGRWQGSFMVPAAKCSAQWLLFGIRSDTEGREVEADLDAVALDRKSSTTPATAD